jgi:predicted Co/Zn/Cd cation transporter (cation efflux family)
MGETTNRAEDTWTQLRAFIVALWVITALACASFTWIAVHYDGPFIMPIVGTALIAVPIGIVTRGVYRDAHR